MVSFTLICLRFTSQYPRSPRDFADGLRIRVDLDAEDESRRRDGCENVHSVRIVKARNNRIHLNTIREYLDGKADFNEAVVEGISKWECLNP